MPLSRLELVSSHGDQTLPRMRFVVHGTSNATDATSISQFGLRFIPGRPTLSTNIVHAHDWTVNPAKQAQSLGTGPVAGEPGTVFLMAIPEGYHVGYGVFTSAYIDRPLKRVTGAPLRYAAARKQLAFYLSADVEAARMHIEAEVANGYPLEQHSSYEVEPKYIIGSFPAGTGFDAIVNQMNVSVQALEQVEFDRLERSLTEIMKLATPENAAVAPTAIRDVLVGTMESIVMSRLRMMRWQGLQLLGYKFLEGKDVVMVQPVRDMAEQRRRMDELGRVLATSTLFASELAWLKLYVAHELELMRVELDGAELEALPD